MVLLVTFYPKECEVDRTLEFPPSTYALSFNKKSIFLMNHFSNLIGKKGKRERRKREKEGETQKRRERKGRALQERFSRQ